MSEVWEPRTVGESVRVTKGVTYASSDYASEDDGHVFLTIKCFAKGGGFNTDGVKYFRGVYLPEQEIAPGELLIAKTDLTRDGDIIGSPMIAPDFGEGRKVLPSMDLSVLRAMDGDTDLRFLFYRLMLGDARRFMWAHSAGSTVLHLESKALPRFAFSAPKYAGQRRIAEILSTLDEAIAQTEALIAKHQQIKAGLMHDLFTRGVTPDGHLRPTREQAPDLYKESPLGWIPKEWEVIATETKVDVIDPQPDHRTPPEVLDGYPYVGIGDVMPTGELDFSHARKVSGEAYRRQLHSFDIHPGAFIFGKIGTLGQPTRIPHERFFAVSANVVLLTTNIKNDADFAFWIYSSPFIDSQALDSTNTTSQPALGIQRIRKFNIPWPIRIEERNDIVLRLKSITETIQADEWHREKLRQQKHGLMYDLLTGRVRVSHKGNCGTA